MKALLLLGSMLLYTFSLKAQQQITDITIPKGKAVICVVWPKVPLVGVNPILLNQRVVFNLKPKTFGYIVVNPGEYTLAASIDHKKTYFTAEPLVSKVIVKEHDFIILRLGFYVKVESAVTFVMLHDVEQKDLSKLVKTRKLIENNPSDCFDEENFELGMVMPESTYNSFFLMGMKDGPIKQLTKAVNPYVANPSIGDQTKGYPIVFSKAPYIVTQQGEDGAYRLVLE